MRSGKASTVPFAVAGYIAAAYWFTSSTSFANPAVTIGRTLTDTFAGIKPSSAPAFIAAELVGGLLAVALAWFLFSDVTADDLVVAHDHAEGRLKDRDAGLPADRSPNVLFLCVHNVGRSQMAMGWFNHLAGDRAVAWSGGSEPSSDINPSAVTAMAEVGIDITGESPKRWTDEIVEAADVVVTMGCGEVGQA